jgi:hypothetical protein
MKLFEIAPIDPKQFEPKPGDKPTLPGEDVVGVGAGVFGAAHSSKTEPGTVRKIVMARSTDPKNLKDDAYFQYVKTITKNERLSVNPYLPKIYDVGVSKRQGDPSIAGDERLYYYVDMERLHHLEDLSEEEIDLVAGRAFYDWEDWKSKRKSFTNKAKAYEGPHRNFEALVDYFIELGFTLKSRGERRMIDNIKDPSLKQAILFVKQIVRSRNDFRTDMHRNNVMVRRGPHAPQLVLTDPVAH